MLLSIKIGRQVLDDAIISQEPNAGALRQLPTPFAALDKGSEMASLAPLMTNGDARSDRGLDNVSRAASVPTNPTARSSSGQMTPNFEDGMRLGAFQL